MGKAGRIQELFGIERPLVQAPMAGAMGVDMVVAVAEAGGLGSLPCALLDANQVDAQIQDVRRRTSAPINVNFFCHQPAVYDPGRDAAWRQRLAPYYRELGLDPDRGVPPSNRAPFNDDYCQVVEARRPEVVSFHFGLPDPALTERVKKTGAMVISSATTVAEARWLEAHGCDAVIAQGVEAGGHRGHFLSEDIAGQVGTMALVPQIVDAVAIPVIAAGGITDARAMVSAFALGASAVQIGTAFLFCPQATIAPEHAEALRNASDRPTVLTNVFTGRPARGMTNRIVKEIGPMSPDAPAFPLAGGSLGPLRGVAQKTGRDDFTPLWAGQAAALGRTMDAGALTELLCDEAARLIDHLTMP